MSGLCSTVSHGAGFVTSMTGYVDCQAEVLGSGAWMALAMPGSTLQVVLTGFLTITIALIGYNLLLGGSLTMRSGTLTFVKIGAVFALATSWPAYRTVVYDLVTDGPGQLVGEIGPRSGVVGSDGTLVQRLDLTDGALAQLANLGTGAINGVSTNEPRDTMPPPFGGFDAFALGGSRIMFLLTAVGALAIIRVVTGLMLALGPFFIAFLMFENTRSLFEGWVRVLGGTALAAVSVSIALGLELALLDPWLSSALAQRMAGQPLPTISTELFVISALFSLLVIAVIASSMRLMRSFRLASLPMLKFVEGRSAEFAPRVATKGAANNREEAAQPERTRAAAIASFIHAGGVREMRQLLGSAGGGEVGSRKVEVSGSNTDGARQSLPLGRSFTRRPGARVSARAGRRDAGQ